MDDPRRDPLSTPGRDVGHPRTPGAVEAPVRARIVLGAAGRERRTLTIFCTRHSASMPLETCLACEHHLAYQDGEGGGRPTFTCLMEDPVPPPRPAPMQVGAAVHVEVACVEPDLSLAEVDARLPPTITIVPVVAEDGESLGVVSLDRHRRSPLSALLPMRELLLRGGPRVLEESTPLDEALRRMASARWRWATVVTREGFVAGVLWDVEAMHHLFADPGGGAPPLSRR